MWRKTEESKPVSSGTGAGNVPAAAPQSAAPIRPPEKPAAPVAPIAQPQETVRTIAGLTAEVVSAPGGVLTSTIKIKGEIRGSDDLYVDGELRGNTQISGGRVTVGPHGRVFGDIEAREIVVRGQVQGALRGRDRLEIARSGEVHGDMSAARIGIEEGARIHGKAEVLRGKEPENRRAAEKPSPLNVPQPVAN